MSKLITEGFVDRFQKLVKKADTLQVVSAWLTQNDGLSAVLARKTSSFKIQAIIGTHGDATDPRSLEKVVEVFGTKSLRIAANNPLFHPKLYLFHGRGHKSSAWIGSANFTNGGMNSNKELILEVDDSAVVSVMVAYFEDSWKKLSKQDVNEEIRLYKKMWEHSRDRRRAFEKLTNGETRKETVVTVEAGEGIEVFQSQQEGRTKFVGKIRYGDTVVPWSGYPELCARVIEILSNGRDSFFQVLADHQAFEMAGKPLISSSLNQSKAREKLYEKSNHHSVRKIVAKENGRGSWWLGTSIGRERLWQLVEVAVDVHNDLRTDGAISISKIDT